MSVVLTSVFGRKTEGWETRLVVLMESGPTPGIN